MLFAVFASMLFAFINVVACYVAFAIMGSICSIVFLSRIAVRHIWRTRLKTDKSDSEAIEEMIEMCKDNSFKICIKFLLNKFKT